MGLKVVWSRNSGVGAFTLRKTRGLGLRVQGSCLMRKGLSGSQMHMQGDHEIAFKAILKAPASGGALNPKP